MLLLLHVWGSAFGLPSIDAECLAAITYLHNALPSSAWRLIPSNDPAVSPSNFLPALNHDGVWTSGYSSIVKYLVANKLGDDLDRGLSPHQRADSISYGAFIGAHAAALVDLSLFVSSSNWAATTRPAYSSLLAFPLTWTIPTLIRAEAIKRAEHLGLAELDSDFDPHGGLHLSAGRDALPDSFKRHLPARSKKTVQDEMTPEQAVAIRLFALAEDCLAVLDQFLSPEPSSSVEKEEREGEEERTEDPNSQDQRDQELEERQKVNGKKQEASRPRSFAATPISSLDCLLFAHLALMIKPPVPRPFLRDCLDSRTPRLRIFATDILSTHITQRGPLPWSSPDAVTVPRFGARLLDSLVRHLPGLGDHYAAEVRSRAEQGRSGLDQGVLMLALGALATGLAAGYGVLRYQALQPFGEATQTWRTGRGARLGEFGELGSMLSSALGPLPTGAGTYSARGSGSGPGSGPGPGSGSGLSASASGGRIVDVDSDID